MDIVAFYSQPMIIAITKGSDRDWINITRTDGSTLQTTFPKKGTIPHDAVHFYVEKTLAMTAGFWGRIADGTHPEQIQEIARQAGHASASRAEPPKAHVIELLQAERLVECFEAELWNGQGDNRTLREIFLAACQSSYIAPAELSDQQIDRIRSSINAFAAQWTAAKIGDSVQLHWK